MATSDKMCRTANGWDINGFGQLKDGRGNICPVTIIMPTLAMEAGRDVEKFMKLLDKKIHEAKDQLIERFEHICSQPAESAKFMYENGTMAGYDGKDIRSALKHGTLAIGQLALAETLQLLIGCNHTTEKGMELAHRIEQLFNTRCKEFKEQYKLNFGVYYTPAENLCHTAYKKFVEKYGHINGITNYWKEDEILDNGEVIPAHWEPRNYFTNSMHVPVWVDIDPFKKIEIESKLTSYSNAGCITYVELPSSCEHNIEALETLVLFAKSKDIPYFAVNIPNDQCQECGWVGEIGEKCPVCGGVDIQRLRRVTGYLTGNYTTAFNPGKVSETDDRVKHVKN